MSFCRHHKDYTRFYMIKIDAEKVLIAYSADKRCGKQANLLLVFLFIV